MRQASRSRTASSSSWTAETVAARTWFISRRTPEERNSTGLGAGFAGSGHRGSDAGMMHRWTGTGGLGGEKQKVDSGRFDCGIASPGAMVQLSILPPGDYQGLAGMGFAWVAPGVDLGVVIVVANFREHSCQVSANPTLDRCTCCPFWLVDTKSLETGMCFISGTEIPLDEKPDMERMQDCPLTIRRRTKKRRKKK